MFAVHLFYDGVDDRYEYLFALFDDLKKGLGGVFDDGLKGADVAVLAVDDTESVDFVEVELVSREFGQQVEGQVEVVSGQVVGFVGGEVVESDDGFVAVDVVHLEEVGHKAGLGLDKSAVECGVVLRGVNIEVEDHLAFVSKGFGDIPQAVAFFFGHFSGWKDFKGLTV